MYDAIEVSKYILDYYKRKGVFITNLKLQKLLYYIQLACLESPRIRDTCFKQELVAWPYGPVVLDVYYKFIISGWEPIVFESNQIPRLAPIFKRTINEVLDKYQETSVAKLCHSTMSEYPWRNAYRKGQQNAISVEDLNRHLFEKGKIQEWY